MGFLCALNKEFHCFNDCRHCFCQDCIDNGNIAVVVVIVVVVIVIVVAADVYCCRRSH